jgi:hypothetical protein
MILTNSANSDALSNDALIMPSIFTPALATPLTAGRGSTITSSTSLIFVDQNVNDYQTLVAEAQPGTELYVLNAAQDAIEQITHTLLGRSGIASISILSHGADGELDFAGGALTLGNLSSHLGELQSWRQALAVGADILLYGCNVAEDAKGQSFVNGIAQATGADVAASSNLTGSAVLGGDWTLEYQTGGIQAAALAVAHYASVLATFHVTNTNDSGVGTLRDAINKANTASGADTIDFTGSIFRDAPPATITLTSGELSIRSDIKIIGKNNVAVSGNNNWRVFDIGSASNVTISGLTIIQGDAIVGNGGGGSSATGSGGGGGIRNFGTLTLNNSSVNNNRGSSGGGIYNAGTMKLNNSGVIGNDGGSAIGGGIYNSGTMTLNSSSVSSNVNGGGSGGGIYNGGTMTLNNSTVGSNQGYVAGGIYNSGTMILKNSTVSANTSGGGSGFEGGGGILNEGTATLNNSDVSNNNISYGLGGGILNTNGGTLNLSNSTVTGNNAPSGGGIYNFRSSTLTLRKSTVTGNTAINFGGGIYNSSTFELINSTIQGNNAPQGNNIYSV